MIESVRISVCGMDKRVALVAVHLLFFALINFECFVDVKYLFEQNVMIHIWALYVECINYIMCGEYGHVYAYIMRA